MKGKGILMPDSGKGLYIWVEEDGAWPPRVLCVIEARNRYDAMDKAGEFAEAMGWGYDSVGSGDVYELMAETVPGCWRT